MPNWCENTMTIYGSEEKMKPIVEIIKKIQDTDDCVMVSLIGPPTDEQKEKDQYYHGQTERFGTKWDFTIKDDVPDVDMSDTHITFTSFLTAWSPPTNFLEHLCQQYGVSAEIRFAEPGCDFAGRCEYNETGLVSDETYEYYEGLYRTDDGFFWAELENRAYYSESLEDFMVGLDFLDDGEKEEAKELYKEHSEDTESGD